jgi:hypothetical protein
MSVQAAVTLDTLRCIAESDRGGASHSEPYLWPFLMSVATSPGSVETTPTSALQAESRRIRKNEMRAGESVALDFPGNRLQASFRDDQTRRNLILIVGLLEADDAPEGAMQAGYQAFIDELRLRLGHHALTLPTATPEEANQIVAQIQAQVRDKVIAAVKGRLSFGNKLGFVFGTFNPDDFVSAAFRRFAVTPGAPPTPFTLRFAGNSGDPRVVNAGGGNFAKQEFRVEFEVAGTLTVERIVADACQPLVDAVNAARGVITSLQGQVRSLQGQLGDATPQQKPGILASIGEIETVRIPAAEKVLQRTQGRLDRCRVLGQLHAPGQPGIGVQA